MSGTPEAIMKKFISLSVPSFVTVYMITSNYEHSMNIL